MGRTIGITQFLARNFKTYDLSPEWISALGKVAHGFRMVLSGHSAQGKTTFALKLAKELSRFGKVYYNSIEEGEGQTLQEAIIRVDLSTCVGRIVFGDRDTFDEMMAKLKTNRATTLMIDSAQYINLTQAQYKQINETFPRKNIVIISWEGSGGLPKGEHMKATWFMVDIKCRVWKGVATAMSRFGPTTPYTIFTPAPVVGETLSLEFNKQ
jgi:hypothetical protein